MKQYRRNMNLPIKFKEKWVNALKSKKYRQIEGVLCNEFGHCAIGVGLVAAGNVDNTTMMDEPNITPDMIIAHNLPFISDCDPILDWIIELNDDKGSTFLEIADFIEEQVDGIDYGEIEKEADSRNVSMETVIEDWKNGSKTND